MDAAEALSIGRETVFVMLKTAGPLMMIALLVGIVVALFQALTQIQEMTLTFVPKIVALFFGFILFMPFILQTLTAFTEELFGRIASPL